MTITKKIAELEKEFEVLAVVDLDNWTDNYEVSQQWLETQLQQLHRSEYLAHQRLVFLHKKDFFDQNNIGLVLRNLQILTNEIDISNAFVVVVTSQQDLDETEFTKFSTDPVPITVIKVQDTFTKETAPDNITSKKEIYQYGSANPIKIGLDKLSDREKFLLTESKTFCMYPWIHLHSWPTGQAFPCCHSEYTGGVGNCKKQTLEEIWNDAPMRQLRLNMLTEQPTDNTCKRCYEQEQSGFFSGRQSANKHHGHHINKIQQTSEQGTAEQFEMTYWDIRFSNLCNLKCRSCGHIFSSQWYQDQAKLGGPTWKLKNSVLNYAGRTETDMWEQLEPHLDYVEQIYFAGGEPLLMEEHYRILDELVRRKRFDVRLIYNTNFTHTDLKGRSVFEYWKQFDSVAVGASLDDSGVRGEYIRKGTDWEVVQQNRRDMLKICPEVDFYISPTLSIMNAHHLPEFHRDWVEQGLIQAQDLNVNILQDPTHYRIDIAPANYKHELQQLFQDHLEWLRPRDSLRRATVGFESAITFMNSTDNTHLIDTFWRKTYELDAIRNENILDIIPELKALK